MPKDIYIKRVYDKDGGFSHLELIQGDNTLRIKLGNDLDRPQSYRWEQLKMVVDKQIQQIKDEAHAL
jgi:hypothetical protein